MGDPARGLGADHGGLSRSRGPDDEVCSASGGAVVELGGLIDLLRVLHKLAVAGVRGHVVGDRLLLDAEAARRVHDTTARQEVDGASPVRVQLGEGNGH